MQQRLDHAVVIHFVGFLSAVLASGDQQDDLAAVAWAIMQKLRGSVNRVIQRFRALGVNSASCLRDVRSVADRGMSVDGRAVRDRSSGWAGRGLRINFGALEF